MTLNIQAKWDALRDLGYTGAQEDMELAYYQDVGATSNNLADATMEVLEIAGYTTGTVTDRWKALLNDLGFTGTVDDMLPLFWKSLGTGGGG
jgi:hypothetical protein